MQIDGIWTVEYYGLSGWTKGGVLFFQNSRVMGGNDDLYVIGSYEASDNAYKIMLEVTLLKAPQAVFRFDENKLPVQIEGELEGSSFTGTATRLDTAAFRVPVKLTKRSDLS